MKKNKLIIIIIFTFLSITGCSDFFDVNDPSNVVSQDELTGELLLPEIEYHTAMLYYSEARYIGMLQQHIASLSNQNIDQHYESSMSFVWNRYYSKILLPLKKMEELASDNNQLHYLGVAKVLDALNLGLVTDYYGDIPYEEAGLGSENLHPNVKSQAEIYALIQNLLNEAIDNLSANDTSGFESVPGDGIYNGDISKWIRLAYTLKARYAMHLSKINGTQAAQDALTYLDNGFTSNDDDFQLSFNDKNKNPWYANIILEQNSAIFYIVFSEQLMNYMNGNSYPTVDIDPRLPKYASNGGDAEWKGAINGNEGKDVNGDPANTYLSGSGYYFKENSPLVMISYAEAMFLKAEAEFIVSGGSTTSTGSSQDAYDAYLSGIEENMNKLGVDSALRDAYLADPAIAVSPAGLKLEHIMKEKYIALLLNPEIYTDMRRYNFSTDVYKDLELPVDQNPEMNGRWPGRLLYPTSEVEKNPNIQQVNFWDNVWWDQ